MRTARRRKPKKKGSGMNYERPTIQTWGPLHNIVDLLLPPRSKSPPGLVDNDPRVNRLRNVVERAPETVWNATEVSNQLGLYMSPRQAHRLFKACTGIGFREFNKKTRLRFAARLLLTSELPIKTVAAEVGYRHVSTFTNSFEQYFGQSPTEFRRIFREKKSSSPEDWLDWPR